jgi:hypothetical protein
MCRASGEKATSWPADVPRALIFSGDLPKHVTVESMTGETKHEAVVNLGSVTADFNGTIVLEIRDGDEVTVLLEPPIPGLARPVESPR